MTDPQVKVYITAEDAFSTQLNTFKRKLGDVAGGMTFTTSATGRWEEGLRRLAVQQAESSNQMVKGVTAGVSWTGGLAKAGNAVTHLTGQLLGANNQVANIAKGLLSSFGVGGPVLVAVAAGITATVLVVRTLTKEWRESQAAYDAYMDSLRRQTPLAIVGRQLDAITEKSHSALQGITTLFLGILEGNVAAAFGRQAGKDATEIERLQKQYEELFNTLGDPAKRATEATSKALALFQENISQTLKRAAEFQANPAWNLEKLPGILGDLNAEMATLRNLIASSKDALDKLRLEDRLRDLVKLRSELARFSKPAPFTDRTRQGATAEEQQAMINATSSYRGPQGGAGAAEQQAMIAAANRAGLSDAMLGLDTGVKLQERIRQFFEETANLIQTEFAQTLGDAIGNAFVAAFRTGNPLKAIEAFGKTMLAGIGSIFVQLGQNYLKYGLIMKALANLLPNPFTAGFAAAAIGVALIALGKALNAVATSGGGGGGGGGGRATSFSSSQSAVATQGAGRFTFIVPDDLGSRPLDPRTIQWVADSLAAAFGIKAVLIPKSAVSET